MNKWNFLVFCAYFSAPPHPFPSHYCRSHSPEGLVSQWELFLPPLLPSSTLNNSCRNCQHTQEFLLCVQNSLSSREKAEGTVNFFPCPPTHLCFIKISHHLLSKRNVPEELKEGRPTGRVLTVPQKWSRGKIGKPALSVALSSDTSNKRSARNTSIQRREEQFERSMKRRRVIPLDRLVLWHVALKRTILPQKLGKCKLIFW